jgi:DNA replication ATP-dependent helicase Dna2
MLVLLLACGMNWLWLCGFVLVLVLVLVIVITIPSRSLSLTRSLPLTVQVGDLLRDWRRINVSFTRAKKKLVIFGSRRTLASDRLLSEFFALIDERGWGRVLAANAHRMHGEGEGEKDKDKVGVDQAEDERPDETETKDTGTGPRQDKNNKTKNAVLARRLLNGRPFVREILDEIVN